MLILHFSLLDHFANCCSIRRLLAFHILIFSSETAFPNDGNLVGDISGRSSIQIVLSIPIRIGNSGFWLVNF